MINTAQRPSDDRRRTTVFLRHLKQAKHYFEFGSGGSTVWAVEQGLTVQGTSLTRHPS